MPKRRKRKKQWSAVFEEEGTRIRVYERANSSALWYSVIGPDGSKTRRSLRTSDRELAQARAKAIASGLARTRHTGGALVALTMGRLRTLYLADRGPQLSHGRLREMTYFLAMFVRHLGENFEVGDISQNDVDAYVNARRSGTLRLEGWRAKDAPADGTIRNELNGLSTACNWATRGGRKRLLSHNPIRGLKLPVEKNRARPRATRERYEALLAVSGKVDPQGRLEVLLVLAWETGRRINALLHLRASDVLLSPDAISRAFAEEGKPEEEGQAEAWQHAIRWRAEWDKMGYLGFSPLTQAARGALTAYLHERPVVGEGFVFPGNGDPSEALNRQSAGYYLRKAEKLAGLTPQKQGGWHAFRRAWATRRKGLPVQDVMAAGGWRDVKALQDAYQGSDPMTTRKVMELS